MIRRNSLICLIVLLSMAGCNRGEAPQAELPVDGVIRVGVVVPAGDEVSRTALTYINQRLPQVDGKGVELVMREGDESVAYKLQTEDGVAGIIAVAAADLDSVTVPSVSLDLAGSPTGVWQIAANLDELAAVSARAAVNSELLNALRVAILVDQADADCVRLATLFSAEIIRQGGVVSDVIYLKRGQRPLVKDLSADLVYIPASELVDADFLADLRHGGLRQPVLLANLRDEARLARRWPRGLDEIYLISDFSAQAVVAAELEDYLDSYRKQHGLIETRSALAMDAYLLLLNQLEADDAAQIELLCGKLVQEDGSLLKELFLNQVKGRRLKLRESYLTR